MAFFSSGQLLPKERYRFKRNSFFAFAACELSVMCKKVPNIKLIDDFVLSGVSYDFEVI